MVEGLEIYIRECEWLANKGFFDGSGIYFGPGADVVPLMFSPGRGHLSGFTKDEVDVLIMASVLEELGQDPIKIFGAYLGAREGEFKPGIPIARHWKNYSQLMGDIRNRQSVESALEDQVFDFLILKGTFDWAYYSSRSTELKEFELFIEYIHRDHTRVGSVILLSQGHDCLPGSRRDSIAERTLVDELGYENETNDPKYLDGEITRIREGYFGRVGMTYASTSKKTNLGVPDLNKNKSSDTKRMLTEGNFLFFRRVR